MEQKTLLQVVERVYMLNQMNGKNRAVMKLNGKAIFICVYQNFWDDLDLADSIEIYFGKYNTVQRLKDACQRLIKFANEN